MKNKVIYIGLNYLFQLLNIALNLIFIQRLPPNILGDIAIAKVWMQAFDYTHLGTRFALDRFLPVTDSHDEKISYLVIALAVSTTGTFLVYIASVFFGESNKIVFAFCIVGIILSLNNIMKAYLRGIGAIKRLNQFVLLLYLTPLCISVFIAYWSFDGFLIFYPALFSLCLLTLITYFLLSGFLSNIKVAYIYQNLFSVVKASKILFLNSVTLYLVFVIDRFFVDLTLGRELLGKYSVIMFVFATLFTVPSILTELIFPKIVHLVVKKNKLFFFKEIAFVFTGTLSAILIANLLIDVLIVYIPQYHDLKHLLIIASWGVLPFSITAIYHHVLNALDRRITLLSINIISLFLYAIILLFCSFYLELDYFVYAKVIYGWLPVILISCYFYYSYKRITSLL